METGNLRFALLPPAFHYPVRPEFRFDIARRIGFTLTPIRTPFRGRIAAEMSDPALGWPALTLSPSLRVRRESYSNRFDPIRAHFPCPLPAGNQAFTPALTRGRPDQVG